VKEFVQAYFTSVWHKRHHETTAWYVLCAIKALSNSWKSLYIHCTSNHQAIRFWNLKAGFTEPSDTVERFAGVQHLCCIYFKSIWSGNTTLYSATDSNMWWYYDEIHSSIYIEKKKYASGRGIDAKCFPLTPPKKLN